MAPNRHASLPFFLFTHIFGKVHWPSVIYIRHVVLVPGPPSKDISSHMKFFLEMLAYMTTFRTAAAAGGQARPVSHVQDAGGGL